jgi:hypothetical protein
MSSNGLSLCARYAYPPNSFSLCGPDKQRDLQWYASNLVSDKGTSEILSQFTTLFPYLNFIAVENNIKEPFDERVVEAYWVGNSLLDNLPYTSFIRHLDDSLNLKKKLDMKNKNKLYNKATLGPAHHSFHVLNVYKRTGHVEIPHTIHTLDACLINFGKVINIDSKSITVSTHPLVSINNRLCWGPQKTRKLILEGDKDTLISTLSIGCFVSYHWGYVCTKLSKSQVRNLKYYTDISIRLANTL